MNSELSDDTLINNLNQLSAPNACVAFRRANQWLQERQLNENIAIIYYTKSTPFAPSFLYHCREETEQYKLIQSEDIFAIKYYDDIDLRYIQRDIGEFAFEMSIFNQDIDITSNNNIEESQQVVLTIVAAISDFICTKGVKENNRINNSPSPTLNVLPPNKNMIINGGNDCCSFISGLEYNDIITCDQYKIDEIEYTLSRESCLFYCDPYHYYLETDIRNWNCIKNYALWVQYYYICNDLGMIDMINISMYNDYKWHCPYCYNKSKEEYKSICTSVDGEQLLNVYIEDNCDCKDITLFLVIIIEIAALLCILIGMFILWYRFNIYKVNQHLKEKKLTAMAINQLGHNPQEIVLNDITNDGNDDSHQQQQQSIVEE